MAISGVHPESPGKRRNINAMLGQASHRIKDVHGCDVSEFLIEKAVKRGISKDKLKICDATNLPYGDDFFDYCYSTGSLEHFTEDGIEKFLISSKRVTKYFG